VERIPDVETASAHRRDWLRNHPAELAWEAELVARLDGAAREPDRTPPDHEHTTSDDGLDAALQSIDLRPSTSRPAGPERASNAASENRSASANQVIQLISRSPLCPDAASRAPIWAADQRAVNAAPLANS
jgi:hypothetical protein